MSTPESIFKVGLALGSGAARGMAHLGVLKVLEEAGVPIGLITGTSFGAFVGANYVCRQDADKTCEVVVRFARSRRFRRSKFDFIREASRTEPGIINTLGSWVRKGIMYSSTLRSNGFIAAEAMSHNISHCIPDCRIEEALLPFFAVAVDVRTGEEILIHRGPMRKAIHASCAIAGVFPPVEAGSRILADGGCVEKVPVLPAYLAGADFVIAVDVSSNRIAEEELNTGADFLVRTSMIEGQSLRNLQVRLADFVIQPPLGEVHWADFRRPELVVRAGETAAREALPELRKKLAAAEAQAARGQSPGQDRARPFLVNHNIRFFEMPEDAEVMPPVAGASSATGASLPMGKVLVP